MTLAVSGAMFFGIYQCDYQYFLNNFSQNRFLHTYRILNNTWYSIILNLINLPVLSGLVFRVGQVIENSPGVHWGYHFKYIMPGDFFNFHYIFDSYCSLDNKFDKKTALSISTKNTYSILIFILIIVPIIASILNILFISIFLSNLSGACL
jgi:hypothetical protein